ncbi:MAG: A/G-specific adenine glycosylase [Rhodobacteraceae bacterium HLUCCA12]|nr:MAG: A/G-specific adenine glycosylase [Rhodobacteraceae bacterium HLUCCA12]
MCDTQSGEMDGSACAAALLRWYDRNARVLPWRIGPAERAAGIKPDPYAVWLSEVMLQQTTVAAVRGYFHRFMERWPDVHALAGAPDAAVMAEWAGLGYYARARNLIACARAVSARGGEFPRDRASLQALPGIGAYTSAAIAAIAFDAPETVVDGNVERVVARLFAERTPLPKAKPYLAQLAARLTPRHRPGDFAQAMMDLGATLCTPRKPACADCPVRGFCRAQALGMAAELPARAPKAAKPQRQGIAYIALRADGALLLETRPPKGLLGGMTGWPCTHWADAPEPAPPVVADWRILPGTVRHTFTHFHLSLRVAVAHVGSRAAPDRGSFRTDFDPNALPTLMRKCWDHAHAAIGDIGAPSPLR